jgi:hypothetical protein
MKGLRFQIRNINGQVDAIDVEGERAFLGSGGHCEIRLPVDQARVEHLRIELSPAGVFGVALAFDPPPTLNGVNFTQGPILPESVLGVGQVQILVQSIELGGAAPQAKAKGISPVGIVGLIMLPIALWLLFFQNEEAAVSFGSKYEAPPLWGEPIATCQQQGAAAQKFAQEQIVAANAKRERRPFYVQDGVAAVPLFERAAACFRVAGDAANAPYAQSVASYLRADLNQDYKKWRVKLRYHVENEDWGGARHDVRALLALTEGQTGDYRSWLQETERRLQLKATRGAK